MSHRPEISGFRLSVLQALLGSKDKAALEGLLSELEDDTDSDDDSGSPFKPGQIITVDEMLSAGSVSVTPLPDGRMKVIRPGGDPEEVEENRLIRSVLNQAVMKEVPFRKLKSEEDGHVRAAVLLAGWNQEMLPTDSNIWKHGAFEELAETRGKELPKPARKILNVFLEGRPLFGKTSASDWSYYGYLTLEEVKLLRDGLQSFPPGRPDDDITAFIPELRSWLGTISDRELDLWFHFG